MIHNSSNNRIVQNNFLIIGYGNELRSDDGIGPQVARTVAGWELPSVKSLVLHQLTPEIAADLADTEYALFVDACHSVCSASVQITPLSIDLPTDGSFSMPVLAHGCSPTALLTLTQRLYGRHPQAWLIQIPADQFGLGCTLSSRAQQGISTALRKIDLFIRNYQLPQHTLQTA
jgi:hydrogenase maturation protease